MPTALWLLFVSKKKENLWFRQKKKFLIFNLIGQSNLVLFRKRKLINEIKKSKLLKLHNRIIDGKLRSELLKQ